MFVHDWLLCAREHGIRIQWPQSRYRPPHLPLCQTKATSAPEGKGIGGHRHHTLFLVAPRAGPSEPLLESKSSVSVNKFRLISVQKCTPWQEKCWNLMIIVQGGKKDMGTGSAVMLRGPMWPTP